MVELNDKDASEHKSAPFVDADDEAAAGARHDDSALQEDNPDDDCPCNEHPANDSRDAETALLDSETETSDDEDVVIYLPGDAHSQDLPEMHVKGCENGNSRDADMAGQDMPNQHPSYIDKNYTELSDTDNSQSVGHGSREQKTDGQADDSEDLDMILESCELWTFPPETAKVFENAIERLWFSESFKIGNAVLPQKKVRSHLYELDNLRLQEAQRKIAKNTGKEIKNTTAYTMAVIFNAIWEIESDVMADPYLNRIRGDALKGGDK